jgi:uncharacterized protein
MSVLQTFTGRRVDLLHPAPADISIVDIAHGLACTNRFAGQLRKPLSVAQHSVYVSWLCPSAPLHALLHDASEAYLVDVPRPLKVHLPQYTSIEHQWQRVIFTRFGLPPELPAEVKTADDLMLKLEAHFGFSQGLLPDLVGFLPKGQLPPNMPPLRFWSWEEAELAFLTRFRELLDAAPTLSDAEVRA